jgi:hypothetical protein
MSSAPWMRARWSHWSLVAGGCFGFGFLVGPGEWRVSVDGAVGGFGRARSGLWISMKIASVSGKARRCSGRL